MANVLISNHSFTCDTMTTVNISAIVDYYANLLIIQYNQLPKAQATIELFVDALLANGVIFDVRDGYDIETAIGAQLDVLAKYIGEDRFYTGQNLDGFFAFATYSDDPAYVADEKIGFADYVDVGIKTGKWLTYDDVLSTTLSLTDYEFRTLLNLKILQNNSNHSDKEIDDGIFELFGLDLVVQDNYDMTMTYTINNPAIVPIIQVAYEKGVLPKPMGVELILTENTA